MKKLTFLFLLSFPVIVFGQKFYVSSVETECASPVSEYLLERGKDVTTKRTEADYIIECNLIPRGGGSYKGYLTIIDAKSGVELARSKEVHKGASSNNALHLPKKIFETIAKKELPDMIEKIKK